MVSRYASAAMMRQRRMELDGLAMCYNCLVLYPNDPPNACYCGTESIVSAARYVRASYFCAPEEVFAIEPCNLCGGHFYERGHFDPELRCMCYRWTSSRVPKLLRPPLPTRSRSR